MKIKYSRPNRRKSIGRGPFVCQNCHIAYFTKRRPGEGEKFCSRDCAFKYQVGPNKHSWRGIPSKPKESVLCPVCNQVVQQPKKSGPLRHLSL